MRTLVNIGEPDNPLMVDKDATNPIIYVESSEAGPSAGFKCSTCKIATLHHCTEIVLASVEPIQGQRKHRVYTCSMCGHTAKR